MSLRTEPMNTAKSWVSNILNHVIVDRSYMDIASDARGADIIGDVFGLAIMAIPVL